MKWLVVALLTIVVTNANARESLIPGCNTRKAAIGFHCRYLYCRAKAEQFREAGHPDPDYERGCAQLKRGQEPHW